MEIKVLASSSEGNAYTVSDGQTTILLECGLPIGELKRKLDFKLPDACLVTHSHQDHAKSVKLLYRLGIPLYMSRQTAEEISNGGLDDTAMAFNVHKLVHFMRVQVGTFSVLPMGMRHDVPCLGFLLTSTVLKESVFFATDTCHIPYRLPPTEYIMVEANYDIDLVNNRITHGHLPFAMKDRLTRSHMEIDDTLAWLRLQNLTKTKRIYLLHLSHGSSNASEFKRRVQEQTGIPTTIAEG